MSYQHISIPSSALQEASNLFQPEIKNITFKITFFHKNIGIHDFLRMSLTFVISLVTSGKSVNLFYNFI